MNAYTLDEKGIKVTDDGYIVVGESGRGRELKEVPVPPGSVVKDNLLIEIPSKSSGVLLYIPDQSGFRGGWELYAARPDSDWDIIVQRNREHVGHVGSAADCQICPQPQARARAEVKIIAQGYKAQGIAGNTGGGPEYLIHLKEGQQVECVRHGRLYGEPAVIRLTCVNGKVIRSDPLKEAESRRASNMLEDL